MNSPSNTLRKVTLIGLVVAAAAALAFAIWWMQGTDVFDNRGVVCLQRSPSDFDTVLVDVTGPGCYSSSCTDVLVGKAKAQVDQTSQTIHITSLIVVRNHDKRFGEYIQCTADCGGAGPVEIQIEHLQGGRYNVWLGERSIGEFVMFDPTKYNDFTCIGDLPTPAPTNTRVPLAISSTPNPTRTSTPLPVTLTP
jgi:hypothetical protein